MGSDRHGRRTEIGLQLKNGTTAEQARILYGRRKGRRLRAGQQRLFDALLPKIEIALPPEGGTLDLDRLFSGGRRDYWLEVGFGAGEHLIHQASANRDIGVIGCEPYETGVARLLSAIEREALDNVRVFRDDARALLPCLSDGALGRVFVLFPDPWPKLRHHKRRFISVTVLRQLARLLRPGCELRVATDHVGYLGWILEHVRASDAFDWVASGPADWRNRPPDWPETRYEAKAVEAGRPCAYLRFKRR